MVQAFLNSQEISLNTAAGKFAADLNAGVQAVGLSFAWGLTDRLTLGIGAPIIRAETKVDIALEPTSAAKVFLGELQRSEYGQRRSALLAVKAVNSATDTMQNVLTENGYAPVADWQTTGLGDATIGAKYRFVAGSRLSAIGEFGVVAPTGAKDDPDILTDIPLGDGQWDLFSGLVVGSKVIGGGTASASVKYTEQLPGKIDLRLRTAEELIAVPSAEVTLDRGSKLDLGVGFSQPVAYGLSAFAGYKYSRRGQDKYKNLPVASKLYYESEKGLAMQQQTVELGLGLSTVDSYKRGSFPLPLMASSSFYHQLAGKNTAYDADRVQVELSFFF